MTRLLPALLALFLAALPLRAQVPSAINVEIDYMVGTWHSHEPARSEIDAVVQMFACQGITLNVVIDDALPHRDVLRRDPDDGDNFFDYDDGPDTFGYLKRNFFDNDGGPWHYAVFGHQYQNDDYQTTSSSGLGEKPGDDFIVTLGDFDNDVGTAWDRAATFAHELGHNLGLGHAGAMDPAVVGSYVPNVPSVMSYFYQLTGVRAAMRCKGLISADADETLYKNLDYSHGRACDLDEGALDEPRGMGIVPVDWDCDGTIGGTVSQDLGEQDASWCGSDADKDYLEDLNEWNVLVDVTQMPASMRPEPEIVSCVTAEEIAAYRAALVAEAAPDDDCVQATLAFEGCTSRRMSYVGYSPLGLAAGHCWSPFPTLQEAGEESGAGDILYLQPGTYDDANLIVDKQLLLLGPGGAVVGEQ